MYEAYFNLKERPFSISPDPRFFYLTSQHKEALTNCQYMITNRVGPVYVHGDVGTGKTTIARRLYQQLLDDPTYIGSATLNRGEVIRSLKHMGPTCMLPDGIAKPHLEERHDGPSASILSQPGLLRQRAGGTGEHHYP
jgi:hypothetical protein